MCGPFATLESFAREAPFAHWLARITVSACYDFLRKERKVRDQVSLDASVFEIADRSVDAASRPVVRANF